MCVLRHPEVACHFSPARQKEPAKNEPKAALRCRERKLQGSLHYVTELHKNLDRKKMDFSEHQNLLLICSTQWNDFEVCKPLRKWTLPTRSHVEPR
jgi:hypothetical protein